MGAIRSSSRLLSDCSTDFSFASRGRTGAWVALAEYLADQPLNRKLRTDHHIAGCHYAFKFKTLDLQLLQDVATLAAFNPAALPVTVPPSTTTLSRDNGGRPERAPAAPPSARDPRSSSARTPSLAFLGPLGYI